jgi:asparagine synthase (glutamine-hydrolysing)
MCGICGFYGFEDKELLKDMCEVMSHRGPDNQGVLTDKDFGMGYRRLTIIDLKEQKQPILHNEDSSVWISFNGEIYNHRSLREELEEQGHRFYTNTDTEVILHLYEELEEDCLKRLRGVFAFAIWDSRKRKLVLARDPLGVKPLYYCCMGDAVIFGSEIKPILLHPDLKREVDLRCLHYFFTLGYTPLTKTIFKGVEKLPPGHMLVKDNRGLRVRKYWDLEMKPDSHSKPDEYYIKKFRELLTESVRLRLMSDVPFGAYLSGGIDSSSIVALMSQLVEEPVNTFSVGVWGPKSGDLKNARIVADHLGTNHRELVVEEDTLDYLPKIVWHYDEPLGDSGTISIYLVSELAKKYCKVVLLGEGSDENLAGYTRYRHMIKSERYNTRLLSLLRPRAIRRVTEGLSGILNMERKLDFILQDDHAKRYFKFMSQFQKDSLAIYSPNVRKKIQDVDITEEMVRPYFREENMELLNQMLLLEIKNYLVEIQLMRTDKMLMANSIEGRVPFLDRYLVEFMSRLPTNLKLKGMEDKYVLRKSMEGMLPESILHRPKKGFNIPLGVWRRGRLSEVASNILSSPESCTRKMGYFSEAYIKKLIEHKPKDTGIERFYGGMLFRLVGFEIWHKQFIESEDIINPPLKLEDFY